MSATSSGLSQTCPKPLFLDEGIETGFFAAKSWSALAVRSPFSSMRGLKPAGCRSVRPTSLLCPKPLFLDEGIETDELPVLSDGEVSEAPFPR